MNVMDQDRSQTKMRPISSFVFLILVLLCFPEANNAIKDDADRAWLQLETDPTGTFFIRLKSTSSNDIWAELHSAETRVGPYSSSEGSLLRLGPPIAIDGEDVFGIYEGMSWGWATKDDPNTLQLVTSIYSYPSDDPELLIFEQHFPKAMTFTDIQKASEQNLSSLSLFPSFRRNPGPTDALKTFSYHGVFPKIQHGNFSNYRESHQGGVPLVLYNKSSPSLPMLVFSPLTWVKASHMASSHALVGAGVKSTVDYIPAGWTQWFLLSASSRGINQGMMEWGDRMLKYNGIQERDNPYQYRDEVHSTIGFWTDNGGYYHYALGNVSRGSTYEDVLPQVKAYHDSVGVPFGHWQFDSWFYPKDGPVDQGGGGGAVVNWTALERVFPSGMVGIQEKLKVPMVMHNRQWSIKNDYRKSWPDIEWYGPALQDEISLTSGMKAAIPKDPLAFFTRFFTTMDGWGLSMYEQDWMCTQYNVCPELQTNISLADLWLSGMAQGAALSNQTVQYCMPYPNDVLSAVAYAAVTNARASDDYANFAANQWNIAPASLFYWAIGILPFKDGFYSSSLPQIGGQTVGPETDPDREVIMATLSCAMVAPMDGIHLLNKTRVMASCNSAGRVLKPDRPIFTPDYCFSHFDDPSDCQLSTTYSDIEGHGRIHYLFDNLGTGDFVPEMIGIELPLPRMYIIYNWYTGKVQPFSPPSVPVSPGYEGHSYVVVSPVISGWAFLGEIDKYVTASNVRFESVTPIKQNDGLQVTVRGMTLETIKVCAVALANVSSIVCQTLKFGETPKAKTVFFSKDSSLDSWQTLAEK